MQKKFKEKRFIQSRIESFEICHINRSLILFLLVFFLLIIMISIVYSWQNDSRKIVKSQKSSLDRIVIDQKPLSLTIFKNLPDSYLELEKIKRYRSTPEVIHEVPLETRKELDFLKNRKLELEQKIAFLNNEFLKIQRINNEKEREARNSRLFFSDSFKQNSFFYDDIDQKAVFSNNKQVQGDIGESAMTRLNSPYVVRAGTLISAILVTGINTSFPGDVIAQVRSNVYDSLTGEHLLIPKGSKLLGKYQSDVSYGQKRVLVAFTRLIRPDGVSVSLSKYDGVDLAGKTGVEGKVSNHWAKIFAASALSTFFGLGGRAFKQNIYEEIYDYNVKKRVVLTALNDLAQTGQQTVNHALNISPTLTIASGLSFNIIVHKDLSLAPYRKSEIIIDGADKR